MQVTGATGKNPVEGEVVVVKAIILKIIDGATVVGVVMALICHCITVVHFKVKKIDYLTGVTGVLVLCIYCIGCKVMVIIRQIMQMEEQALNVLDYVVEV